MSEVAAFSSQGPADTDLQLLMAIDRAASALSSQRSLLAARGWPLPAGGADAEFSTLASALTRRGDSARSDGIKALCLSLEEIARRQDAIAEMLKDASAFETIALEAFAGAMHRMRTNLDIAIGAVEDIHDIAGSSASSEVSANAVEAARALRLIYHYSHELNDMAGLQKRANLVSPSGFDCRNLLDDVVKSLSRMAHEVGAKIALTHTSEPLPCLTDAVLLRSALRHLLVLAIVSPGVTSISVFTRRFQHSTGSMVAIYVTDNGKGLSLPQRAKLSAAPGSKHEDDGLAADMAGFAVARRLARGLGGLLSLEYLPGRGSRSQITFPSSHPQTAKRA